jgi:hypothetical protein
VTHVFGNDQILCGNVASTQGLLLGGWTEGHVALEHKAEHNTCRMKGSESDLETLGPTVNALLPARAAIAPANNPWTPLLVAPGQSHRDLTISTADQSVSRSPSGRSPKFNEASERFDRRGRVTEETL